MKTKLVSATLFAAMMTPATACTDWKAVAAFDAVITTRDAARTADDKAMVDSLDLEHHKANPTEAAMVNHQLVDDADTRQHYADVLSDRAAALADTCQENARWPQTTKSKKIENGP